MADDDRRLSMTAARNATRESILEACWRRLIAAGPANLKIADISREANVSRVTFYQYFRDRDDVILATAEHVSQRFYGALGAHMDKGSSFAEQCFRAGEYICSGKEFDNMGNAVDVEKTALLLTVHSHVLLAGCIDMLLPRIEKAKASGELRPDLPAMTAAEMFARLIFSLVTTPAAYLNTNNPKVVRKLIEQNLFHGWSSRSP